MDNQTLKTFQEFVDFVKNIDNYSAIVDRIKSVTDAHDAAYDKLTQGRTLAQYEASLDKVRSQLDMERREFDKACQKQLDSFAQRVRDLDAREAEVNDRKQWSDAARISIESGASDLQKKSVELDKREQDLIAREAANNQVANNLAARLALIKQAGA